MSSPVRSLSCLLFTASAAVVGSARAQNLEQSFYLSLYPSDAPLHAQVDVPHFDPSLGTLIEARIVLTPHFGVALRAENTDPSAPESVTLLFAGEVMFNRSGTILASAISGGYVSHYLTPFDGTLDFAGPSGMAQNIHDDQSTTLSILPSSPEFAAFVGQVGSTEPGHFEVESILNPQCEPIGNPVVVFEARASVGPELTITYVYSQSGAAFCAGDGSGNTCPCSNTGMFGHGCSSPATLHGAQLSGTGNASISSDTFSLAATELPQSTVMVLMQSDASNAPGVPFGAGLRCVSSNLVRIATFPAGTSASVGWSEGDVPISVVGLIPPGGGTRYYQVSYREPPGACNAASVNFSNGWRVTWRP